MAQLRDAIIQAIIDDPALSAKLWNGSIHHIYDLNAPDGVLSERPNYLMAFTQISSRKITDLDIELPLFQFNSIGTTLVNAIDLNDDLIAMFERFKGNLGNKRLVKFVYSITENDLPDPDSKLYIRSVDIRFKLFGNNV